MSERCTVKALVKFYKEEAWSCLLFVKWVTSHPELLQDAGVAEYTFDDHSHQRPIKASGVLWKPENDVFVFKININPKDTYSKREVLSKIDKI